MGWQTDLRVLVVAGTAVAEGILAGEGTVAVEEDILVAADMGFVAVVHIDLVAAAAAAVGNSDCIPVAVVHMDLAHFLVGWHPSPLGLETNY
jgi:hypothetical protein